MIASRRMTMERPCNKLEIMRNSCKIIFRKLEVKRQLWITGHWGEGNTVLNQKDTGQGGINRTQSLIRTLRKLRVHKRSGDFFTC
jgi:hypothetical protein